MIKSFLITTFNSHILESSFKSKLHHFFKNILFYLESMINLLKISIYTTFTMRKRKEMYKINTPASRVLNYQ